MRVRPGFPIFLVTVALGLSPPVWGFTNLDLETFGASGEQEPTGWTAATRNLHRTDAFAEVRPGSTGSLSFKMDFVQDGFNQGEYYQQGTVTPGTQITMTVWIMTLAGSWYGQGRIAIYDGATTTWVEDGAGWHQAAKYVIRSVEEIRHERSASLSRGPGTKDEECVHRFLPERLVSLRAMKPHGSSGTPKL